MKQAITACFWLFVCGLAVAETDTAPKKTEEVKLERPFGIAPLLATFGKPDAQNFRQLYVYSELELKDVQMAISGRWHVATLAKKQDKYFVYASPVVFTAYLGEKLHTVRANTAQDGTVVKDEFTVTQDPKTMELFVKAVTHTAKEAEPPKRWVDHEGTKAGLGEDHDENIYQYMYFKVPETMRPDGGELSLCMNGPAYCKIAGSIKYKLNPVGDPKDGIFQSSEQLGFFHNEWFTLEIVDKKTPGKTVYIPFVVVADNGKWAIKGTKEQNGCNNPYNYDPYIAPVPMGIFLSENEAQIIRETNKHRIANRLVQAQIQPWLMNHCRKHATHMNQFGMSHSWASSRLSSKGYKLPNSQEDIGYQYGSGENAVTGWKNSPPHNAALLNPNHILIGAGHDGNGSCVVFDDANQGYVSWLSQYDS